MGKKAIVTVVVEDKLSSEDFETFESFTKEEWDENVSEAKKEFEFLTGGEITNFDFYVVDEDEEDEDYSPATVVRRISNETNGVHISLTGPTDNPSVEIITDLEVVDFDFFMRALFKNLGYK